MPGWKNLPGAEVLSPRPRPGCLSTRFREYVHMAGRAFFYMSQTNLVRRHGSGAISLLKDLLRLDWRTRINAGDALHHPYFKMAPLPANPADLPTFEESHEFDRRKFHDRRAALPPAPKGGTVGRGPEANGASVGLNTSDAYPGRNGMGGPRHPMPRNGDERRPAWQRERGLPPRPPPPERNGEDPYRERDRDWRPRSRGNRGPDVDTYIPTYRDGGGRHREDGGRHRDERPRDERPREERPRDERRRWEDRERWHEREPRRTRSRSRSPVRDYRR